MMPPYHLAQFNIARLVAPLDDPILADFVANLDTINKLAETYPGFVWRHQTAEGNSTSVQAFDDPRIIINFSVWESADTLFEYTYYSQHVEFFRRRKEWFERVPDLPVLVIWWIPTGHIPTVAEAIDKLKFLKQHGPTPLAFTFKQRFTADEVTQHSQTQGVNL